MVKHEEVSNNQIPVSKNEVFSEARTGDATLVSPQQSSLFQLHQEMDCLFDDTWLSQRMPSSSHLSRESALLISNPLSNRLLNANRVNLDVSGGENE